jgi:HIV Tat-specific factor 1
VKFAVDILDEGFLRPNVKITVTKASFEYKKEDGDAGEGEGTSGPNVHKKKPKLTQAQIKVARNAVKQALLWNEDDDIGVSKSAALRIIVLEGMFHPHDFSQLANSLANDEEDLQQEIAEECEKFGAIDKITLFARNPRGIVVVKFSTSFAAQECIRVMNGRFFAGRKIKCYFWDGVSNYSITTEQKQEEEEEKQEASRLDEFGDWLEQDQADLPEEFQLRSE